MKISKHASVRSQQRGITFETIELITNYGTPVRKSGDVLEYRLLKKDKKRLIQTLDKTNNKAVIVSINGGSVITVYSRE